MTTLLDLLPAPFWMGITIAYWTFLGGWLVVICFDIPGTEINPRADGKPRTPQRKEK